MVAAEIKTASIFPASIFSVVLGLFLGFIGSQLFFQGLELIPHFNLLDKEQKAAFKLATTLVFCYLAIVVVFQSKDHFKVIIPFVETGGQQIRPRIWILDSSVVIDGRIGRVLSALCVGGPVVVPTCVLDELHLLADSRDRLKRERGRRGLDLLAKLQADGAFKVEFSEHKAEANEGVDSSLLTLALQTGGCLVSNDSGLQKVAHLQGIDCVNLNTLATALRSVVLPGDHVDIDLVRGGEQAHQGLGYLDDGTMVVVENSRSRVGQRVTATVTNVLQTTNGRMIFGKLRDSG